jgi:hypothetical protein
MKTRKETIAVACTGSSGEPDIFISTVTVTQDQYDYGGHYDQVIEEAKDKNYEEPFICFDRSELGVIHRASETLSQTQN